MSEVKLNLIDRQTILSGTIHGSTGDRCVAALSGEPETIEELARALERFEKDPPDFQSQFAFSTSTEIDAEPWDAGILIIDLSARVVACESTYSIPGPDGRVNYHNGEHCTDIPVFYQIPDDWLFLDSVEEYEAVQAQRRDQRLSKPPLDARQVLYGRPLLEFIVTNVRYALACRDLSSPNVTNTEESPLNSLTAIHAQWLLTPREDLRGQSPRDVLLAKQDFIDSDLESRALQWSMQLEGPPGLSRDSLAYQYSGFGTKEWVLYYDLMRHLLEKCFESADLGETDFATLVSELESLKNGWLNNPNPDLDDRTPANIIDNERRRLPEAMGGRSMVVDEDCPLCKMMGDECEAGLDVCFWHLDGAHMDEHFAFSTFATEEEYKKDLAENERRHREFDQEWKDEFIPF